jgi:transcription termination factor Rho
MSEPQLERSVLEAKERDELMAIATALGASPGARAKKADLITSILKATGIEVSGDSQAAPTEEGAAPKRRTRTRRTAPADTAPSEPPAAAGGPESSPAATEDTAAVSAPPKGRSAPEQAVQLDLETDQPDKADDEVQPTLPVNGNRGEGTPRGSGQTVGSGPARNGGGSGGHDVQTHEPAGPGDDFHGRPGDGEPGNRRSRRRRGRDRFERGERDLPGQAPEQQYNGEPIPVDGYLDLRDEGYGFLRTSGFLSGPGDVYVSISQVRRFALRRGDRIEGAARPAGGNEKYPALLRIDKVTGLTPDEARSRARFESLTPLFPDSRLKLELPSHPANDTARIVDLLCPIGKGQRGLIVSPPKAGKTTVLKQIAHCIEVNNPEVQLMVLLVDERPEEVTDMARSVKGEVIASTFDRPAEEHIQVAELTIERAKRMVELGKDVVIILDGITRLARAYNLGAPATGRIMSGGIDTGALYPPKKFFGAARNIEEGGSLTILATALVETGSRMDEVIFEEFKGTGNMELKLDRKLAERRIYPAIDVNGSSTRHEELLFDKSQLQQVWKLRRVLNALGAEGSGSAAAGLELLLDRLKSTKNNDEFLAEVAKTAAPTI